MAEMSLEFIDALVDKMTVKRYKATEFIIRKGETGTCMYFVTSGVANVILGDKTIALEAGSFFGEVALFVDGSPVRMASVQAASEVSVLILKKKVLERILASFPVMRESFEAMGRRRLRENAMGTSGTSEVRGSDWMKEIAAKAVGADPTIQVCLRIRPPRGTDVAASGGPRVHALDALHMYIDGDDGAGAATPLASATKAQERYRFHAVFDGTANNEAIFADIGVRLVRDTMDGFNTCLLAYGQVGSGKSHTMAGLVPRIATEIFASVGAAHAASPLVRYTVRASFLEIAEERLKDLLVRTLDVTELQIRSPTPATVYVDGLTKKPVASADEFLALHRIASKARRAERSGDYPSHTSHCIVSLHLKREERASAEAEPVVTDCCVEMVDLAGTSRATPASAAELAAYNVSAKSLVSLSVVINKLANQEAYVPYRTSKLTWLLSQAFGGDARTYMVATVGPSDVLEARRTIKYAQYAMTVVNRATRAQPKGVAIEKLKSAFSALVTEHVASKAAAQLTLDEIMRQIQRANELAVLTEKQVVFSLQPDDYISAACPYGVRVTSRDSTKTDLWDPATFADRIADEERWLASYWDATTMALREDVGPVPPEPFFVSAPEQQIGTASVALAALVALQPIRVDAPVLAGAAPVGSVSGSLVPRAASGSTVSDASTVSFTLALDELRGLTTPLCEGVYVKYQFPADDFQDEHRTLAVALPAEPDAQAGAARALEHTCQFDADGGDELRHTLDGSELTLEVWGHEPDWLFYPTKLRAALGERDLEIAALRAEIERLSALARKGVVAGKRARQLSEENDALRRECDALRSGKAAAASAEETRLRSDLVTLLEDTIADVDAVRARDNALVAEASRAAADAASAHERVTDVERRLAAVSQQADRLRADADAASEGWTGAFAFYSLLRRAGGYLVDNEVADV